MTRLDFQSVEAATALLRAAVTETPVLEAPALNAAAGRRVLVKAESLQRTGSFKFRGAYFRLSQLTAEERGRGVVAFSSGNFAQALAHAGSLAGIKVTIVMPEDAPAAKRDATAGYGAEVVLSRHGARNREEAANELAMRIAEAEGLTKLHPFDDPFVVAGQGSCGLEFMRQAERLGVTLEAVATPVGGGGLLAGIALAVKSLSAATRVYGVEPDGFDDMARSLASGERQRASAAARSMCDALQAATPGQVPFAVARRTVDAGIAVSDDEVALAMTRAFRDLKLVAEPSGAAALAAVLARKIPGTGPIGVVLSGGNIALDDFRRITETVQ
jgi:threonine dehydratase